MNSGPQRLKVDLPPAAPPEQRAAPKPRALARAKPRETSAQVAERMAPVLAYLESAYPAAKPRPQTARVYAEHLREFDDPTLQEAVRRAVGRSRFYPSVAELLEVAREVRCDRRLLDTQRQSERERLAWNLAWDKAGRRPSQEQVEAELARLGDDVGGAS